MSAVAKLPQPQPEAVVEVITPQIAAAYLEGNVLNRNIRQFAVQAYARDMTEGNWQLTGEAIKFSPDGTLLDGQHRLWAVIEANLPVQMFVVRGIEPEARKVMDSGMKRPASDMLTLAGYPCATLLAATANLGLYMETDGTVSAASGSRRTRYSHTEIMEWVQDNPSAVDSVRLVASTLGKAMDAPPTAIAYAHWVLYRINPTECERFFDGVAQMKTDGRGDPRLAMTRMFATARRNRVVVSHTVAISVIFRAWNAWRRGKSLTAIRTEVNGKPVPIPTPRG